MLLKRLLALATRPVGWRGVAGLAVVCALAWYLAVSGTLDADAPGGVSGVGSRYFKTVDNREYLLASARGGREEWFEITDSPLDKDGYQFGIGKDTIPSIDDPVFVGPDDTRLLKVGRVAIDRTDELRVIGYAQGGEARAYPIGVLDGHELVNDTMSGKPITVGW